MSSVIPLSLMIETKLWQRSVLAVEVEVDEVDGVLDLEGLVVWNSVWVDVTGDDGGEKGGGLGFGARRFVFELI